MKTTISNQEREMIAQMDAQEQHFTIPEKDLAEKALSSIIANRGKLDSFTLADRIRTVGGNMTPKECNAFLVGKGINSIPK